MSGNYGSETFYYLSIRIQKCNNSTSNNTCATDLEIQTYLEAARVSIVIYNSYVDFDDYENPVKTFYDDRHSYEIMTTKTKVIRGYIKKNYVELMDSLIDIGLNKNK